MLGALLKAVLGKALDCVLSVMGILYGVVVEDVRRLCHFSEVRERRDEYLKHRDELYEMVMSGTSSPDHVMSELNGGKFADLSDEDRKVLESDDDLYSHMRGILVFQAIIDAVVSLCSTLLLVLVGVGIYVLWTHGSLCEMLEELGLG